MAKCGGTRLNAQQSELVIGAVFARTELVAAYEDCRQATRRQVRGQARAINPKTLRVSKRRLKYLANACGLVPNEVLCRPAHSGGGGGAWGGARPQMLRGAGP